MRIAILSFVSLVSLSGIVFLPANAHDIEGEKAMVYINSLALWERIGSGVLRKCRVTNDNSIVGRPIEVKCNDNPLY
jgi:hypothetical protein